MENIIKDMMIVQDNEKTIALDIEH